MRTATMCVTVLLTGLLMGCPESPATGGDELSGAWKLSHRYYKYDDGRSEYEWLETIQCNTFKVIAGNAVVTYHRIAAYHNGVLVSATYDAVESAVTPEYRVEDGYLVLGGPVQGTVCSCNGCLAVSRAYYARYEGAVPPPGCVLP